VPLAWSEKKVATVMPRQRRAWPAEFSAWVGQRLVYPLLIVLGWLGSNWLESRDRFRDIEARLNQVQKSIEGLSTQIQEQGRRLDQVYLRLARREEINASPPR